MRFQDLGPKPIIGMLHLAGTTRRRIIKRAKEELDIYRDCGLAGAIIENYHCHDLRILEDVVERLAPAQGIALGVNILPNEFWMAFALAEQYGLGFIQLDHVAGSYVQGSLPVASYLQARSEHPGIMVLGGVHPKYFTPVHDSNLSVDLMHAIARSDAIVVTGEGTGKETPLAKIREFRSVIGSHPLIVGAGLTKDNAAQQLSIADGAIVGSAFKDTTHDPVRYEKVMGFMRAAH